MQLNRDVISEWEHPENPLAPLSSSQLQFINKLEVLTLPKYEVPEEQEKTGEGLYFRDLSKFNEWFSQLESELISSHTDPRYEKLKEEHAALKKLAEKIKVIVDKLDELEKQLGHVSNKTESIQVSCDELVQQQHGLIVAIETLNEKLTYFKELAPMSKKFSSPTPLLLNESLVPTLNRLDECLEFFESKPQYKESTTYLKQFKFFQNQALLTIKNHVIQNIRQAGQQVMPDSNRTLTPADDVFSLFYGRFQSNAPRIKSLVQQIEQRVRKDVVYRRYLEECHESYFEVRRILMLPVIQMAIEDMMSSLHGNHCSLVKNSTSMMRNVCRDEYQLFFQFFSQPHELLSEYLIHVCSKLYDKLRPTIIHMNHLETLSEICIILKNDIVEDPLVSQASDLESFVKVMQILLQDVQERLVYRTNIFIQSSIIGYVPSPGDLAYPEKLKMMESIAETLKTEPPPSGPGGLKRSDSLTSIASTTLSDIAFATGASRKAGSIMHRRDSMTSFHSPADLHGMWYPTVRRTLLCLEKLYKSLDSTTFQGLAQEVLGGCIESLESAKDKLSESKSLIDGQLFLIKHLLIIREQIAPFRIQLTLRDVTLDFSRLKTAALDLVGKRENLLAFNTNNGLLKFMFDSSVPQVVEELIDSQKTLDNRIKITCESFIAAVSNMLLNQLNSFLVILAPLEKSAQNKENAGNRPKEEPPSIDIVKGTLEKGVEYFKTNLIAVHEKAALYLANRDTQAILFRPIDNNVVRCFEQLRRLLEKFYSKEQLATIAVPSASEIQILLRQPLIKSDSVSQ